MPEPQDLKQTLLRQVVDENLSTIAGRPLAATSAALPAAKAARPGARRLLPLALVGSVVTLTSLVLSRSPTPSAPTAFAPPETTAGVALPAAPNPLPTEAENQRFAAPKPVAAHVFPLAVRRLVLDPGHGGDNLGAVAGELSEKDLTLDITQRLRRLLEAASFEVLLTRDADKTLSLKDRALFANAQRADLFVSVHINWITVERVRGVETYYLGTTDDPELAELTRRENHQSGYSLADLRQLLEGIYADVRQDESRALAAHVQRALFESLRAANPKLEDRGVKTAPFVVLVATEMPAILAEVSCLSNQEEAELLSRPLYREYIAEALFRGIQGFARDVNLIEEQGS